MKNFGSVCFTILLLGAIFYSQAFEPQLAKVYQQSIDSSRYLISEKYDGVRAIWNGKELTTRTGKIINAPKWFIAPLPSTPLDGELWSGYDHFAFVSGAVRRKVPRNIDWQQIRYMVFDAPTLGGSFEQRYNDYNQLIQQLKSEHIKPVKQFEFATKAALDDFYQKVLSRGGEGVMLHAKEAKHKPGRSKQLLKYKPYFDAEAEVIDHIAGKGKYANKLGALLVKTDKGVEFKIGTGFSDKLRMSPPKIGSVVTYRYQGLTKYGKPRFARYIRVKSHF
jgi:DNA ligase 1